MIKKQEVFIDSVNELCNTYRNDSLKTLSLRERVENQCELESIRFSGEGTAEGASQAKVEPSPAFVTHFVRTTAASPGGRGVKAAFTLAEILTTLMVIGVVAALTIPTLSQDISHVVLKHQQKVFEKKLEEGLHQMAVQDKLGIKHKNTKAFVKELKNFFSVTTVCDSNNLKNCFNETITNSDGDVFEVENLKSAKDFNSENKDAAVYGVKFPDGTSMLLAYEPNCKGCSSSDIPKDANIGVFAKCFKYIYDVDGSKGDNKVGVDMIGTLSPSNSSFGLPFTIIENKVYHPGDTENGYTWIPINNQSNEGYSDDYWLGAQNFCTAIGGSLPKIDQLQLIADKIYPCNINEHHIFMCFPNTANPLWQLLGNNKLWTNQNVVSKSSYIRSFDSDRSSFGTAQHNYPYGNTISAICIK